MAEAVKVAVRVRPFNDREKNRNAVNIIKMTGNITEIQDPENKSSDAKKFTFDHSYWSHDSFKERKDGYLEPSSPKYADQQKVFDDLGKGMIENAWKGYNCSLFAYGQTGSGKSYSIVGYKGNKGIVPLACEELFIGIEAKRKTASKDEEYQVSVSMLEIYNEQVRDLLNAKSMQQKGGLKVRQHPDKGFYVEALTTCPVINYQNIDGKINEGTRNRTVASTNMNATSSRAHTIVAITFIQKTVNDAGQKMTRSSIINLVDLAGSERAGSTGATGDRLKEGSSINQSLSTLGNVIKALADQSTGKKKVMVPFRDSVLTKLLQNALGGNSKTIMIAALSPADINYEETLSTLRFADRAKAIKTTAVVNESPTDKLIRELREENARLMDMLKGGGAAMATGDGGASKAGYSDQEVEDMRRSLEEQVRINQQEMEENKKSWEQKLAEMEKANKSKQVEEKQKQQDAKVIPHFWNLNEDPTLTGMIMHFCKPGVSKIGNKSASPPAEIQLNGLSIQAEHATVKNKDGTVTIKPARKAKVMINGHEIKEEKLLHHNDRVMFGSSHLYVFHHPKDEAAQLKKGKPIQEPTYSSAQEEIAKKTGLFKEGKDKSKEDLLLQEDLIYLLPMVADANAMSEELDKKVMFELALISPQARGLKDGRTEVMVKMNNLLNGNEWLWDRNKFINRKYLMQEMYQNYINGDKDWDLPQDKDPFWEPADTELLIGTVHVYLMSLSYLIDIAENLTITDFKGNSQGHLDVAVLPCGDDWKETEDEFVEDPSELVGGKINFKLKILHARGLPAKFKMTFCKYKFYLDNEFTATPEVSCNINAEFNYEKRFQFNPVTQQFVDYMTKTPLVIEIWGKQAEEGMGKAAATKRGNTKELMKEKHTVAKKTPAVQKSPPQNDDTYRLSTELSTYKKRAERAEVKLQKVLKLMESAKAKGKKTVDVKDLENVFSGSQRFKAVSNAIMMIETAAKAKREALGQNTSKACSVQ